MNEIALLIAFLSGHTFNTDCVQTQDNGASGYAIDALSFEKSKQLGEDELSVTVARTFYSDSRCEGQPKMNSAELGRVKVSASSGGFFSTNDGEKRYNADWSFGKGTEEGSIGINEAKNEVRIARNQPGFMRNTMLQLIKFRAAK